MRHLLQHGQVEVAGLDQGPGLPDVDGLHPVAGGRVEHVDVSVAVNEELSVAYGDVERGGRVHDFPVAGLTALHVHVDAQGVKDEEELAVGQLDGSEGIHWVVGQEAEHLVVGVDQCCKRESINNSNKIYLKFQSH